MLFRSCDLAGYIAIHKLCIILYCHISIGVVAVGMYSFFSGLFLLCCPLGQPVFIIICVFQNISVFIYGFRQVAVAVVSIRFRHILIVFIDNNLPPSTSTLCSCSYLPHKYANNPLAHLYLQKNTC